MANSITVIWTDSAEDAQVTITGPGDFTVGGAAITFPYTVNSTTKFETSVDGTYVVSVAVAGVEAMGNPDASESVRLENSGVVVRPDLDNNARAALSTTYGRDINAAREPYGMSPTATAAENTAALNAAIADAVGGTKPRRVYVPAGEYLMARDGANQWVVRIPSNVELFGDGDATVFKLAPVNIDTDGWQSIFNIKADAEADPLSNIYLHDFKVDGNKDAHTGTAHENAMDALDTKWCDQTVVLERITTVDTTSDGFDVDNSTGTIIRFCRAYNANGNGFHNSEACVGTVFIGNYAENCGHAFTRAGLDQFTTASKGVYLGNVAKDCYRNFNINGSGATGLGNVSLGTVTMADNWAGIAADPTLIPLFAQLAQAQTFTNTQTFRRDTTAAFAVRVQVTEDTQPRLMIQADGLMAWGSGSAGVDTTLYRSAANQLQMGSGDSLRLDGTWNGGNLRLGGYRLWVDATGALRMKFGDPTADTDGTVVGTQT